MMVVTVMMMVVMVVMSMIIIIVVNVTMLLVTVLTLAFKLKRNVTYAVFLKLLADFVLHFMRISRANNVHCCIVTLSVH